MIARWGALTLKTVETSRFLFYEAQPPKGRAGSPLPAEERPERGGVWRRTNNAYRVRRGLSDKPAGSYAAGPSPAYSTFGILIAGFS
ncbi:hypothetical protein SBV1_2220015 [Verrucomicrobia bacterium]|nr:hypothetical protein SBV1_2220015 [Verrucomicrobiota bacterium]